MAWISAGVARLLDDFRAKWLVPPDAVALLHDPLALASLFAGSWLTLHNVRLEYTVKDDSFQMREMDNARGSPARVSLCANAEEFEAFFVGRVEQLLKQVAGSHTGG